MALFKRKKKSEPEAAVEERDVSPADLPDDEFNDYITGRMNAPEDDESESDPVVEEPEEETEEDDAATEEEAEDESPEHEYKEPFRSFATEDEYNSEVQKAIDEARSKWDLDNEAVKARYERMDKIARAYFPDDENAFDALGDDLESQYQERAGRSYDDYLAEHKRDESAAKWDAQEQAKADFESGRQQILDKWIADAGNLKVIQPDFDLKAAFENKTFTEALLDGDDVFAAYAKAYKGDPDPEPEPVDPSGDEPEPEPEPERKPIPQNGDTKSRRSGDRRKDISKMSSKEFKEYIGRIKNG